MRKVTGQFPETMRSDSVAVPPALTGRQTEILQSLTRGLTNKDIAKQLGLSIRSVEDHVDRILGRIGAANRAEAVAIALRKHLLKI